MKPLSMFTWRALAVLTLSLSALAGPITFVSGDGIGEGNDRSGSNSVMTAHPAWMQPFGGAQWINGGWGQGYPENSTTTPVARFHETFTLGSGGLSGSLWFFADDSAHVRVNGTLAFTGSFILDGACSEGAGGCESDEQATIDIGAYLRSGENRIEFDLFQLGGNVSGLMYGGTADVLPTPEAVTWHLIALPLLVITACAAFTRRRV